MKTNTDQKLCIAILTRDYNRAGGGAERYCVEVTERLAILHEVHVFCQHVHEYSENITFHKIPEWIKRPSFLARLLFSKYVKRRTKGKFDIIHSHVLAEHADIYTFHVPCIKTKWTTSRGWKRSLLWLSTLLSPRKLIYLWLENQQMRPALGHHFISVSNFLSKNLIENYPQLQNHITIAYPGINTPTAQIEPDFYRTKLLHQLKLEKNVFLLLFAAHGFKRKGLPQVISALKILQNQNIHLIIAGSDTSEGINIPEGILSKNIHFIGPQKEMEHLYPAVDALIHPTLSDTYGMVVPEAMIHARPVIVSSSKYCGFSEQLKSKEALLIENPHDASEIALAINSLVSDGALWDTIAQNGRQRAQAIDWDQTLQQTLTAYNRSCRQRNDEN